LPLGQAEKKRPIGRIRGEKKVKTGKDPSPESKSWTGQGAQRFKDKKNCGGGKSEQVHRPQNYEGARDKEIRVNGRRGNKSSRRGTQNVEPSKQKDGDTLKARARKESRKLLRPKRAKKTKTGMEKNREEGKRKKRSYGETGIVGQKTDVKTSGE